MRFWIPGFAERCSVKSVRYVQELSVPRTRTGVGLAGIYPSSFTNVRFRTMIEFPNFAKSRWGPWGEVSSGTGIWGSPVGYSGGKDPENCWPFKQVQK